MSSSNCGDTSRSVAPVSSSSMYLRAMAIAFIAWLMAAGPVATTLGGSPDSRTTLQMAPATLLGVESALTLSRGSSEAATSLTLAIDMCESPEEPSRGGPERAYGVDRVEGREPPGALPPERGGRPPRRPGALPLIMSSRLCGGRRGARHAGAMARRRGGGASRGQ